MITAKTAMAQIQFSLCDKTYKSGPPFYPIKGKKNGESQSEE